MSETTTQEYRETIPLWLAVGITVVVTVPFTLWLGGWNMAVWVSFIVWAEYFALGAKPSAVKTIIPAFSYSAILTGLSLAAIQFLDFLPSIRADGDLATAVALFVGVSFMVYSMKWFPVLQEGSLPFFNGISMVLAVYFTASYPSITDTGWLMPLWAAVWVAILGVFGAFLGVFNVWLTFPKPVIAATAK
jgi:hypothetical protein